MAIALDEARTTVESGALHVATGSYSNAEVDRAIRFVGNDFVESTHCTHTSTTFTVGTGSNVVDFTGETGLGLFQPTNLIWMSVDNYELKRAPLHSVYRRFQESTPLGRPQWVAFEGADRAVLYPQPDQTYTLRLHWYETFTSFTIGTGTPGSVTLNIPEQYVDGVLRWGAATALVYNDPDSLYAQTGWQQYEALKQRVAAQYMNPPTGETASDPRNFPGG